MNNEDHYNECSTILLQLIETQSSIYKEAAESKKSLVKDDSVDFEVYTGGFDPNSYRKSMINEILASDDFIKIYAKLTGRNYRDIFYFFDRTFYIDIKQELVRILNFALMAYDSINRYDQIKKEFENLYFSLYEDGFTVEIQTIMENLDSAEKELLNQTELNINIKKQHNISQTYINYRITDSKSYQNNYLQDPQTIIDIVIGILRIYKSSKINYIMDRSDVSVSIACFSVFAPARVYLYAFVKEALLNLFQVDLTSIVRNGLRHNKYAEIQKFNCRQCNRYFTINLGFEKMHATPQMITSALQLFHKRIV